MRAAVLAIGVALGFVGMPGSASAWSERNCQELCRLTSAAVEACVARNRCARFAAGKHDGLAVVQSKANAYLSAHGGVKGGTSVKQGGRM